MKNLLKQFINKLMADGLAINNLELYKVGDLWFASCLVMEANQYVNAMGKSKEATLNKLEHHLSYCN